MKMNHIVLRSREAANKLAASTIEQRNKTLELLKNELQKHSLSIQKANEEDLNKFKNSDSFISSSNNSVLKRLEWSDDKLKACLLGIDDILKKKDPIGVCDLASQITDGLKLYRVSCPIGVIAVIFEARPEVAIQITSLTIKSGNSLIAKGGSEAYHTNHSIFLILQNVLAQSELPNESVQFLNSRDEISQLLSFHQFIDLIIPRGSKELVRSIMNNTKIPVLGHADGLCMGYVDSDANLLKSVKVVIDSKTDYPSACNAMETLLVHTDILSTFLPLLCEGFQSFDIQFRADEKCYEYLPSNKSQLATDEDFSTEFLSLILAIKSVSSIEEAIEYINSHSSHHTDVILTESQEKANLFMNSVDSAGVYWNCSTRFADGYRYGFGTEVGISTNRIHSRGPMGLEGLLIYKYKLLGTGNTVKSLKSGEAKYSHSAIPIPDTVDAKLVFN